MNYYNPCISYSHRKERSWMVSSAVCAISGGNEFSRSFSLIAFRKKILKHGMLKANLIQTCRGSQNVKPLERQGTQDSLTWSKMAQHQLMPTIAIRKPQMSRDMRGPNFPLHRISVPDDTCHVSLTWILLEASHRLPENCISDQSSAGTVSIYLHL